MNQDMQILKQKYTSDLLARDFGMTDREMIDKYYEKIVPGREDGCLRFNDVPYDSNDRFHWKTFLHLERALDVAIIAKRSDSDLQTEAKMLLFELINEWVCGDYIIYKNEMMNRVIVPRVAAAIALLTWDWLDDKQKKVVDMVVRRGSVKYNYSTNWWMGPDAMWYGEISLIHSLLMEDDGYFTTVVKRIYEEIAYKENGMQEDGSFFQHETRLYNGAFGRDFLIALVDHLVKFEGTSFALTKERAEIIERFILDGSRWMSHRNMFDRLVCGFEFSRREWGNMGGVAKAIRKYCTLKNAVRVDELLTFADQIEKAEPAVHGVKYFDRGEIICAHIDDAYIAFKGISPNTMVGEFCNWEGSLCYNMSYGTSTTVMVNGDEYYGIAPLWNYCRIPGTTTIDETDDELNESEHNNQSWRKQSGDRFDGGQVGDCAWSAQTVAHRGIHATVVCFGTPYGVVLLGSGLRNDGKEPLITTVEQCFVRGEVVADDKKISHNGIQYAVLDGQCKLVAKSEHKTGDYTRINITEENIACEGDVLTITLNRPGNTYAYLIRPETQSGTFELLANSENVQSIRIPDGRVLVHFFEDGEAVVDGKTVTGKAHECRVI